MTFIDRHCSQKSLVSYGFAEIEPKRYGIRFPTEASGRFCEESYRFRGKSENACGIRVCAIDARCIRVKG